MQSTVRRAAILLAATGFVACAEHSPADPFGPEAVTAELAADARLVSCPTSETRSITKTIGPLGGSIELDGTRVTFPVGAVLLPTTITLTLPASAWMEVDLTANALDHFRFPVAVSVSIDYGRCSADSLADRPVTAWYIDSLTKALLEHMGGADDRDARRITFTTIHFSGFSIAQ